VEKKKPHYHGHRERLRARFLAAGFAGLADYEIIELLLTLAIPRADVKVAAKQLIQQFGNLRGILDAKPEEISTVPGLGAVTPVALRIIREAAVLYLQQTAEGRDVLIEPGAIQSFWRARLSASPVELFQVAYLDSGYRLLRDGVETLEEGTIDRASVYPRRVVEAALRRGAAVLVFAHNHPNGDAKASDQDKTLTRALVLAASTVQIKVLDHLIIAGDTVFSFRAEGLL
jgi:DNA repair protein RadC